MNFNNNNNTAPTAHINSSPALKSPARIKTSKRWKKSQNKLACAPETENSTMKRSINRERYREWEREREETEINVWKICPRTYAGIWTESGLLVNFKRTLSNLFKFFFILLVIFDNKNIFNICPRTQKQKNKKLSQNNLWHLAVMKIENSILKPEKCKRT